MRNSIDLSWIIRIIFCAPVYLIVLIHEAELRRNHTPHSIKIIQIEIKWLNWNWNWNWNGLEMNYGQIPCTHTHISCLFHNCLIEWMNTVTIYTSYNNSYCVQCKYAYIKIDENSEFIFVYVARLSHHFILCFFFFTVLFPFPNTLYVHTIMCTSEKKQLTRKWNLNDDSNRLFIYEICYWLTFKLTFRVPKSQQHTNKQQSMQTQKQKIENKTKHKNFFCWKFVEFSTLNSWKIALFLPLKIEPNFFPQKIPKLYVRSFFQVFSVYFYLLF